MYITVSRLYDEVGTYFPISYKVGNLIIHEINEKITGPYKLDLVNKDQLINLMVTTNRATTELEVRGPDYYRKDDIKVWALCLPYYRITEAPDVIEAYLDYFFLGAFEVLKKYNVKLKDIEHVRDVIKKTIKTSPENFLYDEEKERTPEIDLSDLDLD
ncbi:hypothetical protein [Metabacillus indicus]|uniref:Uncharacterized protein n=1 Tax=Metabacillus indicus TaxID=246786 RepID=A0A084GKV3_METID|nr:hypothetical protein [Metabacillus indicus]KEZ47965.1 hypothetical protein GS18_0218475 [Metabacillus indicus]KEZ48584.1 hypothetical protein AZ46_0216870 [Metabacillus indicus LMG 22858]